MELAFLYTKERSEFGKQCRFSDVPATILESIPSSTMLGEKIILKNPCIAILDSCSSVSEHEVNTLRKGIKTASVRHVEGGWPKDVDSTEQSDVNRYRKKIEKDEDFKSAIKSIGSVVNLCLRQNNTVDIYQEYFEGEVADHSSEPPSAKGLAVFRDPNDIKRTATSINWHPEDPSKIAVAYSILNFQDPAFSNSFLPLQSYIWDINNPNSPAISLTPPSLLCCLRYNPKSCDTLVGGSYNGTISFFDLRRQGSSSRVVDAVETSAIEKSHHDPVYEVFWVSSKTGNQCVSVSTDGQVMWWDTRKLSAPTETLMLCTDARDLNSSLGGSCMEYNAEAGASKYLIGTEQGAVAMVNLKNKKQNNGVSVFDQGAGKHHGPIYAIQRNPANPKCFLTIGDWTARIWNEDIRTPIMVTKYHSSYLTGGCWSPTRPGVFFVTRNDGVVDVWDYYYRQSECAYSHKVADVGLSSICLDNSSPSTGGRLVAIGDKSGTISLLQVCESLAVPQANEKKMIDAMFDREMKQEKNLEIRERDMRRLRTQETSSESKGRDMSQGRTGEEKDEKMEELLRKVDADFLAMIKEAEDDESRVIVSSEMESAIA